MKAGNEIPEQLDKLRIRIIEYANVFSKIRNKGEETCSIVS